MFLPENTIPYLLHFGNRQGIKKGRISINIFSLVITYYNHSFPVYSLFFKNPVCFRRIVPSFIIYSTKISTVVIMIILIIIEIEFTALARPISPFRSPVNAGAAAAIGLNTSTASV